MNNSWGFPNIDEWDLEDYMLQHVMEKIVFKYLSPLMQFHFSLKAGEILENNYIFIWMFIWKAYFTYLQRLIKV